MCLPCSSAGWSGMMEVPPIKILSTMRAGRVVRQALYSPREPNPNQRHRAISISKEDKQRANLKTSYEKLLMLVCANFAPGDWWVTLTYEDAFLPANREESHPFWRKYMRYMRKYRKANKEPLLYVYCTQLTTRGGGIRLHHHMIMRFEDDTDADKILGNWIWGKVKRARKLRDWDDVLDKVHYMCREPRELGVYVPGEQMWTGSRGLIRPKPVYTTIDNDAIDIAVPSGCTALDDPVQLPGYGGYKAIIYVENM